MIYPALRLLLTLAFALAGLLPEGFAAGGVVGGGGGGDRREALMMSRCHEGDTFPFLEHDSNGASTTIWRTCKAGRFYPKTPEPERIRCKEGAVYLQNVQDGQDTTRTIPFICRGGKLIPQER